MTCVRSRGRAPRMGIIALALWGAGVFPVFDDVEFQHYGVGRVYDHYVQPLER